MLITLQQSWPCVGTLMVSIGSWPLTPYTAPVSVSEGTDFSIARMQDTDTNCCFNEWTTATGFVSNNAQYDSIAIGWDPEPEVTYIANVRYCNEPCTPRYKDVDTLVSKANCLCTNLGVEVVDVCPAMIGGPQWFAIFDRCQPEDPALNIWGISFHVVMIIMDPNYLLQTIECICGGKSESEYLPIPTP